MKTPSSPVPLEEINVPKTPVMPAPDPFLEVVEEAKASRAPQEGQNVGLIEGVSSTHLLMASICR